MKKTRTNSNVLHNSFLLKKYRPLKRCYPALFILLFSVSVALFVLIDVGTQPHFTMGSRYDVYSMTHYNVSEYASCIIDILTSEKSKYRLDLVFARYGYNHPLVKSGFFKFRIVYSSEAHVDSYTDVTHLQCPCSDELIGLNGLVCRVNYAQKKFPPKARWHFRAMDDTFINLYQLWKQIYFLEQIYNPMTDIVFRAFNNWLWDPYPYVGGGCGWLASNAFVTHMGKEIPSLEKAYNIDSKKQDDTIMYTIVSNIFDNPNQWGSPFYVDYIFSTSLEENFPCDQMKQPPYYAFSEIVSLHVNTGSFLRKTSDDFRAYNASFYLFEKYNESYRYLTYFDRNDVIPCIASPDDQYQRLTLEFENRSYKLVRPENFRHYKSNFWQQRSFNKSQYNIHSIE